MDRLLLETFIQTLLQSRTNSVRADSQSIHSYPQLFSQPLAALDLCALVLLIVLDYEFALV